MRVVWGERMRIQHTKQPKSDYVMITKEEILELEIDIACEFSQSKWEDALIYAWRKDLTISGAIAEASGISGLISHSTWDRLFDRARDLVPSIANISGKNRVRVFIARNARLANDALWEAKFDLAKNLLKKGGKSQSGVAKMRCEVRKEEKKDKGIVFVGTRKHDKRSDWNTVK